MVKVFFLTKSKSNLLLQIQNYLSWGPLAIRLAINKFAVSESVTKSYIAMYKKKSYTITAKKLSYIKK